MLSAKISRRKKGSEFGLYAEEPIFEREFIWMQHEGDSNRQIYLSWDDIQKLPDGQRRIFLNYCYQVGADLFSGYVGIEDVLTDDSNFMNHSCDPNCWYEGEMLVARRDIVPGEEITYDYATDCTGRDWDFQCMCGSRECRGRLSRDDWKKLQPVYKHHFHHHLHRAKIARRKAG
ncbi:MAG: SET domain-containing protein-lysine N-methyltransferase [Spirochaetes bacterium]|nr:MAG: SET domain-containing protein-lysine N-methyltransferase [Spirochaetota bacterium]